MVSSNSLWGTGNTRGSTLQSMGVPHHCAAHPKLVQNGTECHHTWKQYFQEVLYVQRSRTNIRESFHIPCTQFLLWLMFYIRLVHTLHLMDQYWYIVNDLSPQFIQISTALFSWYHPAPGPHVPFSPHTPWARRSYELPILSLFLVILTVWGGLVRDFVEYS